MKNSLLAVLLFLASTTQSQTPIQWSQKKQVAPANYGNQHPRLATDGAGNPIILWGNGNAKRTYLARWTGAAFATPVQVNPDTIPVFAASWAGPDLVAKGDTVYAVFKETPEDVNGVYLRRSTDGGATFAAPVRVDAIADSISRFPSVGVGADGNPLVVFMKFNPGWTNSRYVLAKSTDLGDTFSPDVEASGHSGGTVCDCCPAGVTASDEAVAVLYRDNLNNIRDSWAGVSFDGGASFPGGLALETNNWFINACPSTAPDGVILGDTLYSVFMNGGSGKALCYFSRAALSNLQLIDFKPLTGAVPGLASQNFPRIAARGNVAAVVWKQAVSGSQQLAFQFTDNLAEGFPSSFSTLVSSHVENADVALSEGKIHVVWEDAGSGTVQYQSGTFQSSALPDLPDPLASAHIFPNPAGQASDLKFRLHLPDNQGVTYVVFNAQGQRIFEGQGRVADGVLALEIPDLPDGLFNVQVNVAGKTIARSFVVRLSD